MSDRTDERAMDAIYEVPADALVKAAEALVRSAGTPPRGVVQTPDVVHAMREAGIPLTVALEGGRGVAPAHVADAAKRLRDEVREAVFACYGDVGGPDDTAEDVARTEAAIARDMVAVLDWVVACSAVTGQT